MSDRLDLSVAAAPESVRELEGAVEGFGAERGWPLDVIFQMQLVVEELATNIVRVAGAGDCIDLSVRSSDDEILVEMVDRGPAFNPLTDAPEPDLDSPLEDRPIGGLGPPSGAGGGRRNPLRPGRRGQPPHHGQETRGMKGRPHLVPLLSALCAAGAAAAGPGVTDERVLFGQSAAFSGPAADLGKDFQLGIEAAFAEVNRKGGVHGRELELRSLDDAYEPELAIANTRRLIEQEGVFALIGAVGTPTSRAAVPLADAAGVPYLAPFTGAAFLREAHRGTSSTCALRTTRKPSRSCGT